VRDEFGNGIGGSPGEPMSEVSTQWTVAHGGIEWKAVPERPYHPTLNNYWIAWAVANLANKEKIYWTN
jgi:hypothetical protein